MEAIKGQSPVLPVPATSSPTTSSTDRQYLARAVDDAAVVQVYADGFSALPLKDKTLAWHLYQASLAGRDIFYDQSYVHNLDMRDLLEAIVTHPAGVDASTLAEIQRYTKLFWINSGPVQQPDRAEIRACSAPRMHLRLQPAPPRRPARTFPLKNGETLDQLLARLRPASSISMSIRWSPPRLRHLAPTSWRPAATICTWA